MARESEHSDFDHELIKDVTVSRDFRHAHPELVKRFRELGEAYQRMFPQRNILVTLVYRSPAEQRRIYQYGRTNKKEKIITNCDGIIRSSQHNLFPSRGICFAILDSGRVICCDEPAYYPFGALAKEVGLEWGGFCDDIQIYSHVQLPHSVE